MSNSEPDNARQHSLTETGWTGSSGLLDSTFSPLRKFAGALDDVKEWVERADDLPEDNPVGRAALLRAKYRLAEEWGLLSLLTDNCNPQGAVGNSSSRSAAAAPDIRTFGPTPKARKCCVARMASKIKKFMKGKARMLQSKIKTSFSTNKQLEDPPTPPAAPSHVSSTPPNSQQLPADPPSTQQQSTETKDTPARAAKEASGQEQEQTEPADISLDEDTAPKNLQEDKLAENPTAAHDTTESVEAAELEQQRLPKDRPESAKPESGHEASSSAKAEEEDSSNGPQSDLKTIESSQGQSALPNEQPSTATRIRTKRYVFEKLPDPLQALKEGPARYRQDIGPTFMRLWLEGSPPIGAEVLPECGPLEMGARAFTFGPIYVLPEGEPHRPFAPDEEVHAYLSQYGMRQDA